MTNLSKFQVRHEKFFQRALTHLNQMKEKPMNSFKTGQKKLSNLKYLK